MKNQPTFALVFMFLLIISSVGYGSEYWGQDVVEQKTKGVINWSRGIIQAKGLRTKTAEHSDVVISNTDAHRLRSAFENLSFMRKCRVIIVID